MLLAASTSWDFCFNWAKFPLSLVFSASRSAIFCRFPEALFNKSSRWPVRFAISFLSEAFSSVSAASCLDVASASFTLARYLLSAVSLN